ncbi:MAG: methyltransferase [Clostridia bacterium]|nr:methyltransferase [Clostridia bacterium]
MEDIILNPDERLDKVNEDITIIQKKNGLTFGTDAYLLAAFMKEQRSAKAVELGAGTGIISLLSASKGRFAHITAVEIQKDFSELCERNASLNSLSDTLTTLHADIRDITVENVGGEVDVVFSNPPYMKRESGAKNEYEIKYIARHEVCGTIVDFCLSAKRLLKHGGRFYCVYRPDRLSELLVAMSENMIEPKKITLVSADVRTPPSIALVMGVKGGAASMTLTRGLYLYESSDDKHAPSRKMSFDAERIYETMSFEDFEKKK